MPLLRKRPSNVKYSEKEYDKEIAKAAIKWHLKGSSSKKSDSNNEQTPSSPEVDKSKDTGQAPIVKKSVNLSLAINTRHVPEVVYSSDGRKFFPCHFCCRAFAFKKRQVTHMDICIFKKEKGANKSDVAAVAKPVLEDAEGKDENDGSDYDIDEEEDEEAISNEIPADNDSSCTDKSQKTKDKIKKKLTLVKFPKKNDVNSNFMDDTSDKTSDKLDKTGNSHSQHLMTQTSSNNDLNEQKNDQITKIAVKSIQSMSENNDKEKLLLEGDKQVPKENDVDNNEVLMQDLPTVLNTTTSETENSTMEPITMSLPQQTEKKKLEDNKGQLIKKSNKIRCRDSLIKQFGRASDIPSYFFQSIQLRHSRKTTLQDKTKMKIKKLTRGALHRIKNQNKAITSGDKIKAIKKREKLTQKSSNAVKIKEIKESVVENTKEKEKSIKETKKPVVDAINIQKVTKSLDTLSLGTETEEEEQKITKIVGKPVDQFKKEKNVLFLKPNYQTIVENTSIKSTESDKNKATTSDKKEENLNDPKNNNKEEEDEEKSEIENIKSDNTELPTISKENTDNIEVLAENNSTEVIQNISSENIDGTQTSEMEIQQTVPQENVDFSSLKSESLPQKNVNYPNLRSKSESTPQQFSEGPKLRSKSEAVTPKNVEMPKLRSKVVFAPQKNVETLNLKTEIESVPQQDSKESLNLKISDAHKDKESISKNVSLKVDKAKTKKSNKRVNVKKSVIIKPNERKLSKNKNAVIKSPSSKFKSRKICTRALKFKNKIKNANETTTQKKLIKTALRDSLLKSVSKAIKKVRFGKSTIINTETAKTNNKETIPTKNIKSMKKKENSRLSSLGVLRSRRQRTVKTSPTKPKTTLIRKSNVKKSIKANKLKSKRRNIPSKPKSVAKKKRGHLKGKSNKLKNIFASLDYCSKQIEVGETSKKYLKLEKNNEAQPINEPILVQEEPLNIIGKSTTKLRTPLIVRTVKHENRLPTEVVNIIFNSLKENKTPELPNTYKPESSRKVSSCSGSANHNKTPPVNDTSVQPYEYVKCESPITDTTFSTPRSNKNNVEPSQTSCKLLKRGILQLHKKEMIENERAKQNKPPVNESVYDFDETEDEETEQVAKRRKGRKRTINKDGSPIRKRQRRSKESFSNVIPNLKELEADIAEVSITSKAVNFPLLEFSSALQPKVCPFPYCSELFRTEAEFIEHKIVKHQIGRIQLGPDKLRKYDKLYQNSDKKKCPICFRDITITMNWKRHLKTHSKERDFSCTICKKTFSRADHMKNHEKRHLDSLKKAYGVADDVADNVDNPSNSSEI